MMHRRRSGFTLVELLVAMTIFVVVITIATGAFIRALRTQHQLVSFSAANSNLSLVLEQMAREIRVGRDFAQPGLDSSLSFTNARGENIVYTYDEGAEVIYRQVGNAQAQPLTSDGVSVKALNFWLQFAGADGYPARVTITASVSPKEAGVNTSVVHVQTTVSARNIST